MTTLGDQIKAAREREHLSQRELARRLGVAKNTVSNWESGMAPKSRLAALRDALPTFNPDLDPAENEDEPTKGADNALRAIEDALRAASNNQLISELLRRLDTHTADAPRPARLGANYTVPRADESERTSSDDEEDTAQKA